MSVSDAYSLIYRSLPRQSAHLTLFMQLITVITIIIINWSHHCIVHWIYYKIVILYIVDHINPFSAGTDFRCQNLTSIDVTFLRLTSILALKELNIQNGYRNIGI